MSGIFVNSEPSSLEFLARLEIESFEGDENSYIFAFDKSRPPLEYSDDDVEVLVCGTFELNGVVNDIVSLALLVKNQGPSGVYRVLEYGNFCAIVIDKRVNDVFVFSDPLGLFPVFYSIVGGMVKVAPSVALLDGRTDEVVVEFIDRQSHSVGQYTAKKGVFRLLPFEYLSIRRGRVITVHSWQRKLCDLEHIADDVKRLVRATEGMKLAVALSSGFDSRLLAAAFLPRYVYCWGPRASRDVKVSTYISTLLRAEYLTFSLPEEINEEARFIYDFYCVGNCNQNARVVGGYQEAYRITKEADICLDGYLGDVFQRGTYFFGKGVVYELAKIFPVVHRWLSPEHLLAARYRRVWREDDLRNLVVAEYQRFIDAHGLEKSVSSVVAFDHLWGRGLRLISTGGINANSFYNRVLAPLASPRIITYLLRERPQKIYRLRNFKRLWTLLSLRKDLMSIRSEHYISVNTWRILIYPMSLIGRILVNYVPGFGNYGK